MHRILFISLMYLLIHLGAAAQYKLGGQVQDGEQQPLEEVTLRLQKLNEEVVQPLRMQIATKDHFIFKDLQKGLYLLEASKTGYSDYSIYLNIQKDSNITLRLPVYTKDLETVSVHSKTSDVIELPDKTVFKMDRSVTAAGANVLTAVSKLPGIKIEGGDIVLTGKGSLKIMIDNKMVELSQSNLSSYLASYNSALIDKIELITHPDASYDAAGAAGILHIITKSGSTEGWSGSMQGSYGQQNTYNNFNLTGSLNYQKNKWNGFANVSLQRNKALLGWIIGVEYPDYSWSLNDTGIYKMDDYNAHFGLGYQISKKSRIQLSYQYGYHEEGRGLGGHDDVKNYIINRQSGQSDSVVRSFAVYNPVAKIGGINLHYNTAIGDKGATLSSDVDYFNFYRTDYSNFKGYTQVPDLAAPASNISLFYNTAKQNIRIYTFKADIALPTSFADLKFGVKSSNIKIYSDALYYNRTSGANSYDSSKSNIYDYSENTQAVYIQGDKKWDAFIMNMGLRAEYTSIEGHSISLGRTDHSDYIKFYPSLSLSYTAGEHHKLWLEFGKRINRPTFWNLNPYRSLLTSFAYYDGNPALSPEYISQLELGHSIKNLLFSRLYYRHLSNGFTDLTIGKTDTFLVYRTPMNFLSTDSWGLQENLNLQPFRWWELGVQANLYYTKSHTSLDYVKAKSGWGEYLSMNNNIYLNAKKTFSGAVNYWCQFPETSNISRSNTYHSLDLGLRYQAPNQKWVLGVSATDIFKTSAPTYYTEVNGLPQRYEHFQLNRSVTVSLSYSFGRHTKSVDTPATGNEEERSRL